MNLKMAKRLRKEVRKTYPYCSSDSLVSTSPLGVALLSPACQRFWYQETKRAIKKARHYSTEEWTAYLAKRNQII